VVTEPDSGSSWRAVISIGEGIPSEYCIWTNAHALARFAALSQEAGLVPIVEPEVLMEGDHPIERSEEVTGRVLHEVFDALFEQGVRLEGMVLKPNMVLSGYSCPEQATVEEVAERTVRVLKRTVPAAQPGIVFLSGGQSDESATAGEMPTGLRFAGNRSKDWRSATAMIAAKRAIPLPTRWCRSRSTQQRPTGLRNRPLSFAISNRMTSAHRGTRSSSTTNCWMT
jgi:hypothetical protein